MFVLGYSAFTAYKVYDYYLLSESVEPLSMNWKIQKMAEDDFVVQANYQYQWQKSENGDGVNYSDISGANTINYNTGIKQIYITTRFDP